MSCNVCLDNLEIDDLEPGCISGACPIKLDQLDDDDLRILEAYWLATHLSELGLSMQVVTEYHLNRDDLYQLATIESESRKISTANQGDTDGERR